jgi:hypothetical protein
MQNMVNGWVVMIGAGVTDMIAEAVVARKLELLDMKS